MCSHNQKILKQIFFPFHRCKPVNGSWNLKLLDAVFIQSQNKIQTKPIHQPIAKPGLLFMLVYLAMREGYRWALQWIKVSQSLQRSHRPCKEILDRPVTSIVKNKQTLGWSGRRPDFKQFPIRLCSSSSSWDPRGFYSSSINGSLRSTWYPPKSLPFLAVCLLFFSVSLNG